MTDQTKEPASEPQMQLQNIKVKLRPINPDDQGFLTMWRQIIQVKRGMMDLDKAQPEDVDAAVELLIDHIIEPEKRPDKVALLSKISQSDLMNMFNSLMGQGEVPPANGGA